MRVDIHSAPNIRNNVSNRTVMGDVIITTLAIYAMCFFYYGERSLVLGAISVLTCSIADILCTVLARRRVNLIDYSAIVTGLIIPLAMPATISYKEVVFTALFAICVVKQPFGGVGNNIFNPAAGGLAFAIVCFGNEMFLYPAPFTATQMMGETTTPLYSSLSYIMYVGGLPKTDFANMMLGLKPGPMGATNILVLAACALYLVLRHTVRIQQVLLMLATVFSIGYFFPRVNAEPLSAAILELIAMPTLFFALFLFSDPVTTPARASTKAVYAVMSGIVLMLFRRFGSYEMMAPFAILFMNMLTPAFDQISEAVAAWGRRHLLGRETKQTYTDFSEAEDD